jgi:hypothetical protein
MGDSKIDHRVEVLQRGYIVPLGHENDETERLSFNVETVGPCPIIHQPAGSVFEDISQLTRIPITKITRTIQKDQQRPFLLPRCAIALG